MDPHPNTETNELVSVAIDIGTSFSGYAYLTRSDFIFDPPRVYCPQWPLGELGILYKTKTAILLDENKKYIEFGYEAEKMFIKMRDKPEVEQFYFFRNFKMILYGDQSFRRNIKIADEYGRKLPARIVFSESIRYLKDYSTKQLTSDNVFKAKDIKWVITLPAIWNESAKQFMYSAALEAGIDEDHLDVTLEPESAALCCNYMELERTLQRDYSAKVDIFSDGRKIMILDLGGGTVDITAYQIEKQEKKNRLKEIYKATGGPWGGRTVDQAFEEFWISCLEKTTWKKLKETYPDEIIEFFNSFEIQKRNCSKREQFNLTLPECIREIDDFKSILKEKCGNTVTYSRGKVSFSLELFEAFFRQSIDGLKNELLSIACLGDMDYFIMVGGFSESEFIKEAVKYVVERNSKGKVLCPIDPGSIILKGAAIYGYQPDIIIARVSRFTYGVSTRIPFNEKNYSRESRHYTKDGQDEYIEDIFHTFICTGDTVIPGKTEAVHRFRIGAISKNRTADIEVYSSTQRDPIFTRDPENHDTAWKIGCVQFLDFGRRDIGKEVTVRMKFGYVKLHVNAELETGESVSCKLNLLR